MKCEPKGEVPGHFPSNGNPSEEPAVHLTYMPNHATTRTLIVIHGWGGTFSEAIAVVRGLLAFDCWWHDGFFYVPARTGLVLRRLLNDPQAGVYGVALQKLVLSRFLACSTTAPDTAVLQRPDDFTRFGEAQLLANFGHLGLPFSPAARARRAARLRAEAERELQPLAQMLNRIEGALSAADGRLAPESEARRIIRDCAAGSGPGDDLVHLLETLRDMHETGGDVDTVTSAVFYTHWLRSEAESRGHPLEYGRDYRYVFVNYHESLRGLAACGPAQVLMADLPIGAFPEFEGDVRHLAAQDISLARFEDHHPVTVEQRAMLEGLASEGLIGFLSLSGPLQGSELKEADLRCGADMAYDSTVAGRPWDGPGVRELRLTAHAEDFVSGRTDLGKLLTDLIRGGICKVELVQLLVDSILGNDAMARLRDMGWDKLAADWRAHFDTVAESLRENAFMVRFKRPPASRGIEGQALGIGSDVPATSVRSGMDDKTVCMLVALAARSEPGQPRIATGRAIEFLARSFPQADYVLYCFGSSIMVARRLNQADLAFNLGVLMPTLGAPGDGGHAGAANCRPERNRDYPRRLLGPVNNSNFSRFVDYLALRIGAAGYELDSVSDASAVSTQPLMRGGRALALVILIGFAIGLLLVLFDPAYRRAEIQRSNENLFPQIAISDGTQPPTDSDPGGEADR